MADPVQLTDLDVITRYSIAVRKATADRDELIETLRADLSWLEHGLRRTRLVEVEPDATEDLTEAVAEAIAEPEPRRPSIRRMPAKVTPSRRAAAKPTAKKAAAKKATPRRASR